MIGLYPTKPMIVIMGVSGCGKSSLGSALAERLGLPFIEGDTLHPATNISKMSRGIPLDDDDRWPWLNLVGREMAAHRDTGAVTSCSALKHEYRELLRSLAGEGLMFLHLAGTVAELRHRLAARTGHFMQTNLLESQFAALELPPGEAGVMTLAVSLTPNEQVDEAIAALARLMSI